MSLHIELQLDPEEAFNALVDADALPGQLDKYGMAGPEMAYFKSYGPVEDDGIVNGLYLVVVYE